MGDLYFLELQKSRILFFKIESKTAKTNAQEICLYNLHVCIAFFFFFFLCRTCRSLIIWDIFFPLSFFFFWGGGVEAGVLFWPKSCIHAKGRGEILKAIFDKIQMIPKKNNHHSQ